MLTQAEIRKIRQETDQGTKVDGIVISKQELDWIKRSTKITTKEQELENKKLLSEQREQQQLEAKARKTKIQDFDKIWATKVPPNENETFNKQIKDSILAWAEA